MATTKRAAAKSGGDATIARRKELEGKKKIKRKARREKQATSLRERRKKRREAKATAAPKE